MDKEIFLNDFAIRSFRNIGDDDYITARMTYRAKLAPQFLWSGLQAIEKYLKCILLLNRIPAKCVKHNLTAALKLTEGAPFELGLRARSREFIAHLDTYGRSRYLEYPFHLKPFAVEDLDMTVWHIRRYCQVLHYSLTLSGGKKQPMLDLEMHKIKDSENHSPQKFVLVGGTLEKIIADKQHPAREALIWQNLFFGMKARTRVKLDSHLHSTNSPLSLHPEMLDEVLKYIYLPQGAIKEYTKLYPSGHSKK